MRGPRCQNDGHGDPVVVWGLSSEELLCSALTLKWVQVKQESTAEPTSDAYIDGGSFCKCFTKSKNVYFQCWGGNKMCPCKD